LPDLAAIHHDGALPENRGGLWWVFPAIPTAVLIVGGLAWTVFLGSALLGALSNQATAEFKLGHWGSKQASTKLREHLASVVTAMQLSDNYDDFIQKLDRVKPRFGDTLPLPLEGPKEKIEPL
jgi:hypothetical protein